MHPCKRGPQIGHEVHVNPQSGQPYVKVVGPLGAFTQPLQILSKVLSRQRHAFVAHARGEGPSAHVKRRTHVPSKRTCRLDAVARCAGVTRRHEGHLAVHHGVAIAPLEAVHEVFVGAQAVRQAVLLVSTERPTAPMLDATGSVLPVVGLDVQSDSRGCRCALKPTQRLGHGRIGQDVAKGQFGPSRIHHAVQLVPVAPKPRLVHLGGHGPTGRRVEFMAHNDMGMVGDHEVLGRSSVATEGVGCKVLFRQAEVRFP